MNSHIFTNKNGNTLMREFEGVLSNNPSVGFLRASGYFSLCPFLDNINKVCILIGIDVDKYIVEAIRQGGMFFGAEEEVKEDCLRIDSDEKLAVYFFPQNSRGDVKAKFDKTEDADLLDFITSKYKLYNSL